MGTPGYSPPEAIKEGRYTPQADVFAWGAVMYELMSGRIPYEGPDTKTTNGYVVQGNAPPPTRHDPSIPAPLAEVTMRALQPSDKTRFKDASEAEAALREAWDVCLTQGIVHPAVLAMDEITHDKAPARMHEPKAGTPRPISAFSESQQLTAIDPVPPGVKHAVEPMVVESGKKRVGDDDPTLMMVREQEVKAKVDATTKGIAPAAKDTLDDKATNPVPQVTDKVKATKQSLPLPVMVAIAVLLLAAATVGGLYLGGIVG
jgi:serine/threonine-protein kinase